MRPLRLRLPGRPRERQPLTVQPSGIPVHDRGDTLRIGEVAALTGISSRTLRFYEAEGLLTPAGRSGSGYRLYRRDVTRRILFIRKARALALSLADIRSILEISDGGGIPCAHVAAIIDRELSRVDEQMTRLRSLRRDLVSVRERVEASPAPAGAVGCSCMCEP
jgi:DNA-binding transcriptional MerR regulator